MTVQEFLISKLDFSKVIDLYIEKFGSGKDLTDKQKHDVEQNFFFLTTYKRYQVQLQILNDLEKTIKQDGILVTKEYVKGRKNVYSHPAISDYNRTTDSANKTVVTLMKIITTLRDRQDGDEPDPLLQILQGKI